MSEEAKINKVDTVYDRTVTLAGALVTDQYINIVLGRQNVDVSDEFTLTKEAAETLRQLLNASAEL